MVTDSLRQFNTLNATDLWCRVTNALIKKYKEMADSNPEKAVEELLRIEGALIGGGFITYKDLQEAL